MSATTYEEAQEEGAGISSPLAFLVGLPRDDFAQMEKGDLDEILKEFSVNATWNVRVKALWRRMNNPAPVVGGIIPPNPVIDATATDVPAAAEATTGRVNNISQGIFLDTQGPLIGSEPGFRKFYTS
jgi:hypothetical protein